MNGMQLRVVPAAEFVVLVIRLASSPRGIAGQAVAFYGGADTETMLTPATISGTGDLTEFGYSGC
jgi:hypothetical protein